MRESWKLYEDIPAENVALRNTILKGIRQDISMYRKHQRMILPSPDEVYYHRTLKNMKTRLDKAVQREKMRPMKTNDTNVNHPGLSQSVKTKHTNAKRPYWW